VEAKLKKEVKLTKKMWQAHNQDEWKRIIHGSSGLGPQYKHMEEVKKLTNSAARN